MSFVDGCDFSGFEVSEVESTKLAASLLRLDCDHDEGERNVVVEFFLWFGWLLWWRMAIVKMLDNVGYVYCGIVAYLFVSRICLWNGQDHFAVKPKNGGGRPSPSKIFNRQQHFWASFFPCLSRFGVGRTAPLTAQLIFYLIIIDIFSDPHEHLGSETEAPISAVDQQEQRYVKNVLGLNFLISLYT